MQIRINDKTLDTRGITPRSPLEEQVMLIWYTAHARVAAADDARQEGMGVQGSFNMHWHIKDLFSCTDDEARYVSSRVRQVLKKTSAARCVSVGGAGHAPIWWISDTLPDNIITVAEWVTAHHKTVDPQREGYKPTRAEKRLSEHEAGEDRPAAPVTVTKLTGDEVTSEALLIEPQDTEEHTVEVEGPVDNPHADHIRKAKERQERWVAVALQVLAAYGPLSGNEVTTMVNVAQDEIELATGTVNAVLRDMTRDGDLFARRETLNERVVRQTEHDRKGGQPAMLYAVNLEQLTRTRDTYVDSSGQIRRPGDPRQVEVTPDRLEALEDAVATSGPVTVINNTMPPAYTPDSVVATISAITYYLDHLVSITANPAELEDLRTMNGLLEEENTRLRSEVDTLRAKLTRARAAFED
jgi:hypothetical protein